MCKVSKGCDHGPAPIPQEGAWTKVYEIKDVSGLSHGIGWCAPQQGTCKLTLNVKEGIIQEALVETIGCSGMTHSAAMAGEILPGKTLLEALNTDLVCDAINVAMREIFKQLVYGRTQTAFSEDGLPVGAGLEDLGKGLRSQTATIYSSKPKGVERWDYPNVRSAHPSLQSQPLYKALWWLSCQDKSFVCYLNILKYQVVTVHLAGLLKTDGGI